MFLLYNILHFIYMKFVFFQLYIKVFVVQKKNYLTHVLNYFVDGTP